MSPTGRLDVLYYDRRANEDNVLNEVSLQASDDGGRTFTDRLLLSDVRFDSRIGWGSDRNLPDLGSRLALLSSETRALAVWSDTRAGTPASGKQDLVRAVAVFSHQRGLAEGVDAAMRYGGAAVAVVGLVLFAGALLPWRRREEASRRAPPARSGIRGLPSASP